MSIPLKGVATTTCDLLVTSNYGGGQTRGQSVVAVDDVLTRTIIRIVPRGANLLGVQDEKVTFVSNVTATPIQNLRNFNNALRRFQVGRAGLSADHIEFATLAHSDVRARIHVATTLTTLKMNKRPTGSLARRDAFECFSNDSEDVVFTLPPATRACVGLEFFFAANPAFVGGNLTIACENRDAIQIRAGQSINFAEAMGAGDNRADTNGVVSVESGSVVRCQEIKATCQDESKGRTTVVIACRGRGQWVAESVAAYSGDFGKPDPPEMSLWEPIAPVED
tara:strand:- start:50077 stop:50916 length:840 start_codon:yes stop_codon:yes gene_type:complete